MKKFANLAIALAMVMGIPASVASEFDVKSDVKGMTSIKRPCC